LRIEALRGVARGRSVELLKTRLLVETQNANTLSLLTRFMIFLVKVGKHVGKQA